MKIESCTSCRSSKAGLHCQVCQESLCKKCSVFLDESTFSFLTTISDILKHTHYCHSCYDANVVPALENYNETMELAREMYVFFSTRRKPVPIIRKGKEKVRIKACADRNETILRMAFQAATQGFNGLVEVEVTREKIRDNGYQRSSWEGLGIPAEVDVEKIERSISGRKVFD